MQFLADSRRNARNTAATAWKMQRHWVQTFFCNSELICIAFKWTRREFQGSDITPCGSAMQRNHSRWYYGSRLWSVVRERANMSVISMLDVRAGCTSEPSQRIYRSDCAVLCKNMQIQETTRSRKIWVTLELMAHFYILHFHTLRSKVHMRTHTYCTWGWSEEWGEAHCRESDYSRSRVRSIPTIIPLLQRVLSPLQLRQTFRDMRGPSPFGKRHPSYV